MAKKKPNNEPAIRKSFLITGGVAVAAAVLGFVVMTFVVGGGGDDEDLGVTGGTPAPAQQAPGGATPAPVETPKPAEPAGLTPGGRDPFSPLAGGAVAQTAVAAETAIKPVAVTKTDEATKIAVLAVYGGNADIKVGDLVAEGVKPQTVLTTRFNVDEITKDCVYFKDDGERFKVCSGKSVTR